MFKKRKRQASRTASAIDKLEESASDDDEAGGSAVKKKQKLNPKKVLHKMERSNMNLNRAVESSQKAAPEADVHSTLDVMIEREHDAMQRKVALNKSKFYGPKPASANVRSVLRVDYQPDLCKDYKETGYCGYGDSCKFLHDRGDYKTGWQLDREFEEQQKRREMMLTAGLAEEEENYEIRQDDDLPWACLICRQEFTNPVVTLCGHYFCESCALKHHQKDTRCFACQQQTSGIFNTATKLIALIAQRKELGLKPPSAESDGDEADGADDDGAEDGAAPKRRAPRPAAAAAVDDDATLVLPDDAALAEEARQMLEKEKAKLSKPIAGWAFK